MIPLKHIKSHPGNTWTAHQCSDDRALYIGWSVTGAVSSLTLLREMREQSSTEEGTKFIYTQSARTR